MKTSNLSNQIISIFLIIVLLLLFMIFMDNMIVAGRCDVWSDKGFMTEFRSGLEPKCFVTNDYGVRINMKDIPFSNDFDWLRDER